MDKLDPKALAECGDAELDDRVTVQPVTPAMIREHVVSAEELPIESARPFAAWLDENWNGYNEEGNLTNGDVIAGALAFWRGQ